MHERKALMAELADGFIALPGGFGTLDELAEALTWTQLGLQAKPVVLLDVDGFWEPLVQFFDAAVEHGFVRPAHRMLAAADGHRSTTPSRWPPAPSRTRRTSGSTGTAPASHDRADPNGEPAGRRPDLAQSCRHVPSEGAGRQLCAEGARGGGRVDVGCVQTAAR